MNQDLIPVASAPPNAAPVAGARAGASPVEQQKVRELAREFESFFVLQMVRQMRACMLESEQEQGLGADTMTETIDVELARHLTGAGGMGLARVLETAIGRQMAGGASQPVGLPAGDAILPAVPAAPEPSISASPARGAAVPLPLAATFTSPFGWRDHPCGTGVRFHNGVDIKAAYGQEVPAVGQGRVVFSGAQGGYGNTVVIEHADGVRTRYAHLSTIQVEAGDPVATGTVVGRVGSSGRSTGPHLHFEVTEHGRPVNPVIAATRFAGRLKLEGVVADFPHSQPSMHGVAAGVDDEDPGQ